MYFIFGKDGLRKVETVNQNLIYEMPSPFIGGTTALYDSTWVIDWTIAWKVTMRFTTHATLSSDTEEFGVNDPSSMDDRFGIGMISGAKVWARVGKAYHIGDVLSPNTEYEYILEWNPAGSFSLKVNTIEVANKVANVEPISIPFTIGARKFGSNYDRNVLSFDVSEFKVEEV